MYFVKSIRPSAVCLSSLILLSGAFFLLGCEPEASEVPVSGQAFLIMPEGESLRLGSVKLQVFKEKAIREHMADRQREVGLRREELRDELSQLEGAAQDAADEQRRAEAAYEEREAAARAELAALGEEQEPRIAKLEAQIESNKAFIDSVDSLPPAPDGIPSREEYEAYHERRTKWLSMDREERKAWGDALASLNKDLEAELATMAAVREDRVFVLADELQELDDIIAKRSEAAREASEAVAALKEESTNFPDYADFLTGLPAPLEEARTDADGEFLFSLPPSDGYVLFAVTERVYEGEAKEFKWFVEIVGAAAKRGSRVILSNHNLISNEGADSVIVLPSPIAKSES